jgi:hypothetical protein
MELKLGLKILPTATLCNINCENALDILVKDQNSLQSVED